MKRIIAEIKEECFASASFIRLTICGIVSGCIYSLLKSSLLEHLVDGNVSAVRYWELSNIDFHLLLNLQTAIYAVIFTIGYLITWILFAIFCDWLANISVKETLKKDSWILLLSFSVPVVMILRFNVKPPYFLHIITAVYILMIVLKIVHILKHVFHDRRILTTVKLFVMMFLMFFLFNISVSTRCITGDEPHYLMMTHSIINDGDLDLHNNYISKDYLNFYKTKLEPLASYRERKGIKRLYSFHEIGLSIILIPGYMLAKQFGASVMMNVFAALIAVNLYLLLANYGINRYRAQKMSILFSMVIPVALFAYQLFPEALAALIILYTFRKIYEGPGNSIKHYLRIVIPLAILPWLSIRYTPGFMGLVIFLIYKMKYKMKTILSIVVPILFSYSGLFYLSEKLYGSYSLMANRGIESNVAGWFDINLILNNTMMLLLDRQVGLFMYSPVLVFCVLGAVLMLRNKELIARFAVFIISIEFIMVSMNVQGASGDWAPPARYLVSIIPLLYIFVIYAYEKCRNKVFRNLWNILLGYSIVLTTFLMANPVLQYNNTNGNNTFVSRILGKSALTVYNAVFPSFIRPSTFSLIKGMVLAMLIVLINVYFIRKVLIDE